MSRNSEYSAAGKGDKVKLSPKELIFKYIIYLPLFVLSVGLSIAVAYIYLRYQIPNYNSYISILIKDDKNSRGGSGGAEALDEIVIYKSKTNLSNEIEILKSSTLMTRVVKALKLNTQYIVEGNLKRTELYHNSFYSYESITKKDSNVAFGITLKFDKNHRFQVLGLSSQWYQTGELIHGWQGDFKININNPAAINPEYKYIIAWQPPFQTASSIAPGLNIRQLNAQASILRITITTEIPQKGQDILNELVNAYNTATIENKNRVVDNTVRFIDGRLILLTNELGKVEQRLQDYKQGNEIVDINMQGGSEYEEYKGKIEKLNDQQIRLQVIDMLDKYVTSSSNKYTLVPSTLGIDDPTLGALVINYNNQVLEREGALKNGSKEGNPRIAFIENQLDKIRINIIEDLSNIRKNEYALIKNLTNEANLLKAKINELPSKERELNEIG